MPMSGSNYVAPTWVDNAPPALDAAELQAMCDTIQENQGDISSLTTEVDGKPNMQIKSYVGTGTYGTNNRCSITASFPIKALVFSPPFIIDTYILGNSFTRLQAGQYQSQINVSVSGNTANWYHESSADYQMNIKGQRYYVLVFG